MILNRSKMTPAPCGAVLMGFEQFSEKGIWLLEAIEAPEKSKQ